MPLTSVIYRPKTSPITPTSIYDKKIYGEKVDKIYNKKVEKYFLPSTLCVRATSYKLPAGVTWKDPSREKLLTLLRKCANTTKKVLFLVIIVFLFFYYIFIFFFSIKKKMEN